MMTVSTWPALVWRTSSSSVILAVFSCRRDCPLVRSARVVVDRSRVAVPVRAMSNPSCLFETDEDVLDFRVELERVHAELATDAAALVAAEWCLLVDAPAAVDAQHPGLDAPRDPQRATDVAGPDRARESVGGVVDQPQDLVLAIERDDGQHRAEDLLLGDPHSVVGAIEYGRLEVAAARQRAAGRRAARQHPRSLALSHLDVRLHPLALFHRDQRTNLGRRIEWISKRELPAAGSHPLVELLGDGAMDEGAASGAAVLAGIAKDAADRGRQGLLPAGGFANECVALFTQLE